MKIQGQKRMQEVRVNKNTGLHIFYDEVCEDMRK